MENVFDVGIVGGGIIGLMSAAVISMKRSNLKIAILDKDKPGCGATQYSAAFSTPLSKGEFSRELILRGIKLIPEIQDMISMNLTVLPCIYVVSKSHIEKFKNKYVFNDLVFCDSSILKSTVYDGVLDIPDDKVLFFSGKSAHCVNIAVLVEKLISFLKRRGCKIFNRFEVKLIEEQSGSNVLFDQNHLSVKAKKVLFAVGPWYGEATCIKKITAFHLNIQPGSADPAVVFFSEGAFLLPMQDENYTLFSFKSEDWKVSPDDKLSVSKKDVDIASEILGLYDIRFNDVYLSDRVFCDSYSENGELSLQYLKKNVMSVMGASGSGYRLSYGLADKILEEICYEN